jgi:hypothetical protein
MSAAYKTVHLLKTAFSSKFMNIAIVPTKLPLYCLSHSRIK